MTKNYHNQVVIVFFFFFSMCGVAQNEANLWSRVDAIEAKRGDVLPRKIQTTKEMYYQLNLVGFKNALQNIGNRENPGNTVISLPKSNGEMSTYKVFEASIMEPALQAKYPQIKSYAGQGIENPSETIRFSITDKGLHCMFLGTEEGTQFIDPYTKTGNIYTVYSKGNTKVRDFEWECGVIDDPLLDRGEEMAVYSKNATDGTLRDYRIAIACTGEYGTFHGGTVASVMNAMNVTLTRVNGIYERELSFTMTMVDNTSIIFLDGDTDPFDNTNAGILINQSQSVIDSNIGSANYDIGHTFSTGISGGLAQLQSACFPSGKARGVTGIPQPVGDVFDIQLFGHELGHQFGAPHSFNGNAGSNCANQRSASDAYEPGSGSTIMAYAGLCAPQNVQNSPDFYFHQISLVRMFNHALASGSCPTNRSATGNTPPTVDAGSNFIIPQGTPYKLTGSSTDPDGTATHTYTWEQFDLGPTGAPTETTVNGPIVRSYEGTSNPVRYVPRLQDLAFSGGSTDWEKLSTVDRDINYRLTVRDNDIRGGQADFDQMTATVTTNAGPFIVTSQNTEDLSWDIGSTQTITWDVAGTTGNGINEANVNILLSTDGETYAIVLASNVPNDGSHDITVPSGIASVNCRVMVEAANGIFFNINSENISIGASLVCNTYSAGNVREDIPDGSGTTSPVAGTPLFDSINVPDDVTIESMTLTVDIDHTYIGDLLLQLQHPDIGSDNSLFVNVFVLNCGSNDNLVITFEDGAPPINCASPTTGVANPENPLSLFNGLNAQGNWSLAVVDFFSGDVGQLNTWSLEFCTSSALSIEEEEIESLSVFPNPNKGEFTVGFNPSSGDEVKIEVYDIGGRVIYSQSFSAVSRFEELIKLNNAQSGLYLLNIVNGTQSITKKIIVD